MRRLLRRSEMQQRPVKQPCRSMEPAGHFPFTADRYGMSSILEIGFDNQQLAAALGFTASGGNSVVEDPENKGSYVYGQIQNGKVIVPSGTDAEVTLTKPGDGTGFGVQLR